MCQLRIGEPVRTLDGRTATVAELRVMPGAAAMWDLTVSNVHDFAVGDGCYVVHNCPDGTGSGGTAYSRGGVRAGKGEFTLSPDNWMDPTQKPGEGFEWKGKVDENGNPVNG